MRLNSRKIAIFGAGGTGAQTARTLGLMGLEEIALVDIDGALAEAMALDLSQTTALTGKACRFYGGNDTSLCRDAAIVIVTAGVGRKPGIKREQMLTDNAHVIQQIADAVLRYASDAFVIILTNPADLLARYFQAYTGWSSNRIVAQGGILDSARLSTAIATTLHIDVRDVRSMVLGAHGDLMVPLMSASSVHGVPASTLLSREEWARIVEETRFGGNAILHRLKTRGASLTPGLAVAQMALALSRPTPYLLPISCASTGAFGLPSVVYLGLPALLSNRGVEKVLSIPLTRDEQAALTVSARQLDAAYGALA